MSRGVIPPDRAGKLIILAIVAPLAAKKLKPAVKLAGQGLVKAGEFIQRMAEEANGKTKAPEPGTPEEKAASNSNVNEDPTKVNANASNVPVEASSPIGHEEMEAHTAAEAAGDGATPDPAPAPSRKAQKTLKPDQKLNPRRTKNSRPS